MLSHEGRVIELEYPDFTFLNIYFPNGGASEERLKFKLKFYGEFLDYIKAIKLKDGIIITFDQEEEFKLDGKKIVIKPVWKWLLEEKT